MANELTLFNFADEGNKVGKSYSSLLPTDKESAVKLYNAMNNPDERLADHINETIEVEHLYCEYVECINEETGAVDVVPRTVLFDSEGKTYAAVSRGIFTAMQKICMILGAPANWVSPVVVKVKQVTNKKNKMLSLELVDPGDNL